MANKHMKKFNIISHERDANINHNEVPLHAMARHRQRMARIKEPDTINC